MAGAVSEASAVVGGQAGSMSWKRRAVHHFWSHPWL